MKIKYGDVRIIQNINKYLIDYNFFIAFCSVALLAYFSLLMKYAYPVEIYVFTFCSTLSTYNLFRDYQTFGTFKNDFGSIRFFIVMTGFVIGLWCYFLLPYEIKVFYVVLGAFTMLYKFNIFGITNLRSIPYLKLPMIAVVWVLTGSIFLLININSGTDLHRITGVLFMQFFFFIAITIPFDVFGLIEDEMLTIPGRLGIRKSLWISKILLVLYFVVALLIYQRPVFLYASGLVAVLTILAVHFSPRFEKKAVQYYLLDGTIIFQTLIFYLFLMQ